MNKLNKKPKNNKITKKVVFFLCSLFVVFFFINPINIYAADALVVFGSDSYESEIGAEFPVGVYIDGSEPIGYYRVEIEYDPERLEYIGGGSSGGEGVVLFEGNGTDVRESTMLSFIVKSGGSTTLKIGNVEVRIPGSDELFNITDKAEVPVVLQGEDLAAISESAESQTAANDLVEAGESESAETDEETDQTVATERKEKQNSDIKDDTANGLFLPVVIIAILAGILGIIIATVAVRKSKRKKRLRKEYIKNKYKHKTEEKPPFKKDEAENAFAKTVENTDLKLDVKNNSPLRDTDNKDVKYEGDKAIINVRDVSMNFSVSGTANSGFKDYAIQKIKGKNKKKVLNALKHVSFDIYKGEIVGIIGTNGSGKSTLLKIISGAMKPSSGSVTVEKSKVQLLTLGTGFDAELTAKENIYLNGAIIGYTKEFIDAHYDEIVEFAELEDFMDEKVKNFSSGMVSRLGFSIATVAGTSEILILDEVLSVGDQFFKSKSMKRIKEMIHGGSTVLIVSHSLGVIKSHCDKVIWLEKGVIKMVGKPETVCAEYSNYHP